MEQALTTGRSNNALLCMLLLFIFKPFYIIEEREAMKAYPARRSESTTTHIVCKTRGCWCSLPFQNVYKREREGGLEAAAASGFRTNDQVGCESTRLVGLESSFCPFPRTVPMEMRAARPSHMNIQTWDHRERSSLVILQVAMSTAFEQSHAVSSHPHLCIIWNSDVITI